MMQLNKVLDDRQVSMMINFDNFRKTINNKYRAVLAALEYQREDEARLKGNELLVATCSGIKRFADALDPNFLNFTFDHDKKMLVINTCINYDSKEDIKEAMVKKLLTCIEWINYASGAVAESAKIYNFEIDANAANYYFNEVLYIVMRL